MDGKSSCFWSKLVYGILNYFEINCRIDAKIIGLTLMSVKMI